MVADSLKELLATSASICTVLQFLAGTLVCRKFIINGKTGDTSGFSFIACLMSCCFWMRYGQLIGDIFVIWVNVLGAALQFTYIGIYSAYCVQKTLLMKQMIATFTFIIAVFYYSIVYAYDPITTKYIGFLSCGLTILFFASPLTMLAHVIQKKSAESLPFPVIVSTFVVSLQWFVYGELLHDSFIIAPNLLGCILSAFQLSLFIVYPTKKLTDNTAIV